MKVQLHTDSHVVVDAELSARIEARIAADLDRFADHLTTVEVHLSDEGAGKRTGADVRCVLEARAAGVAPTIVTADEGDVAAALDSGVEKAVAALTHTFGRREDRGARETIRGR